MKSYQEQILEARANDKYVARKYTINEATRDCFTVQRLQQEMELQSQLPMTEEYRKNIKQFQTILTKYGLKS